MGRDLPQNSWNWGWAPQKPQGPLIWGETPWNWGWAPLRALSLVFAPPVLGFLTQPPFLLPSLFPAVPAVVLGDGCSVFFHFRRLSPFRIAQNLSFSPPVSLFLCKKCEKRTRCIKKITFFDFFFSCVKNGEKRKG